MAIGQRGLEKRLEKEVQRISSQHRQLDSLYAIAAQALEKGPFRAIRDAFLRFSDALEAHIALEDEFFFPAVRGLRPEFVSHLKALAEDHLGFRADLERLKAVLERGDLRRPDGLLPEFLRRLAAHEEREEKLLAQLGRSGDDLD